MRFQTHLLQTIVRCAAVVSAVVMLALTALTLYRSFHWPLIGDAATMCHVAWRISRGDIPYRDILDINMPGSFLIHILELHIFGLTRVGWRLFDLSILAMSDFVLFLVARRFIKSSDPGRHERAINAVALVAPLIYSAFHLFNGADQSGQRDYLIFLFIIAAGLFILRSLDENANALLNNFFAGLCMGMAAMVKPFTILFGLGLIVITVAKSAEGSKWKIVSAFCLGTIVVVAAFGFWLIEIGAMPSMIDTLRNLPSLYYSLGGVGLMSMANGRRHLLIPCLIVSLIFLRRSRGALGAVTAAEWLAGFGCVYGWIHFLSQGRGFLYHLYPLIGFTSIIAAAAGYFFTAIQLNRRQFVAALAGLSLIAGLDYHYKEIPVTNKAMVPTPLADLLTSDLITAGDGRLQIFGTLGEKFDVLIRLRRSDCTSFIADYPVLQDPNIPYVSRLRAEMMRQLSKSPPRIVVVMRDSWPYGGYERIRRFPELASWLDGRYALAINRGEYRVFLRK